MASSKEEKTRHPIQPVQMDKNGTLRFKGNAIVRHLLDEGGISLNDLAVMRLSFPREDWEQFAQLIEYSLSGFGSLSYASDDTYEAAKNMYESGNCELAARLEVAEARLSEARDSAKDLAVALFSVHPDDLTD